MLFKHPDRYCGHKYDTKRSRKACRYKHLFKTRIPRFRQYVVSTIGTFSIALSCPQQHVASSIPRKKEQQRWTCVDPHHPWHLGYEYLPYLQLRCVGRWRWIGWSGWRGRRRRQRPQGQRWRQACTVMMEIQRRITKVSICFQSNRHGTGCELPPMNVVSAW